MAAQNKCEEVGRRKSSHLFGGLREGFLEAGTFENKVDRKVLLPSSEMGGGVRGCACRLSDVRRETEAGSMPRIHRLCPGHLQSNHLPRTQPAGPAAVSTREPF